MTAFSASMCSGANGGCPGAEAGRQSWSSVRAGRLGQQVVDEACGRALLGRGERAETDHRADHDQRRRAGRDRAASAAAVPTSCARSAGAPWWHRLSSATGSSGPRPAAIRASAIAARCPSAMYRTIVRVPRASAAQSTSRGAPLPAPCPVTSATEGEHAVGQRDAGVGEAADPGCDPGTTRNGTPAAASASASSPPRPNTNGSPPLRRSTRRPPRAARSGAD